MMCLHFSEGKAGFRVRGVKRETEVCEELTASQPPTPQDAGIPSSAP